jgi:hypothetical protein
VYLFALVMVLVAGAGQPTASTPAPIHVGGSGPATRAAFVSLADRVYREIDTNGRGYVDKSALRRIYSIPNGHGGGLVPFPMGEASFDAIDANHDGRITEREYVDFAGRMFDLTAVNGQLPTRDPAFWKRYHMLLLGGPAR